MADVSFLALVGPTCIGKTKCAHEIVATFPVDLVSIDSFQVYDFFRMGTGRADLRTDRAHLYGFQSPLQILSAKDYLTLVRATIDQILATGRYPFFEGGSISYLRTLMDNYTFRLLGLKPSDPTEARESIEQRLSRTSEELLISEITEGLRNGYRHTIVMRDDVVYLPYVEYLDGKISLLAARERARSNLFRRYETQMQEYASLTVEWFTPSDRSTKDILKIVGSFLESRRH